MRLGVITAFVIGLAQSASALTCLRPDIARDFAQAAASDDQYIVVKGKLSFDTAKLPKTGHSAGRPSTTRREIDGWLNGYSLTLDGFTNRFRRDVTLRVACAGPWCGIAEPGVHIVFLKKEGTAFVMTLDPCGNFAYRNPSPELEQTVTSCMQNGPCTVLQ